MNWKLLPETVCRMDATSKRTWMYLQRVAGNSFQFMPLTVNGTAVLISVYNSDLGKFEIHSNKQIIYHLPDLGFFKHDLNFTCNIL